jgi:protein-S-isoprenylcysteine O-methyltransferase Ste14
MPSIVLGYVRKSYDEGRYLPQNLRGYGDYAARVRYRLLPWIW